LLIQNKAREESFERRIKEIRGQAQGVSNVFEPILKGTLKVKSF